MILGSILNEALRLAREGRFADAKARLGGLGQPSKAPEVDHCWGRVLALAGEPEAAIERYRAYLRRVPANHRARAAFAALLAGQGKTTAARRELADAAGRLPPAERALVFTDFANTLVETPQIGEAMSAYERAVELCPEHAQMRLNLASALSLGGQKMLSIYHLAAAQGLDPSLLDSDDPDYIENHLQARLGLAEDPERQRAHAMRLAGIRTRGVVALPPPQRREEPGERLRIGYVSPDFRQHAVASFFAPVLEAHDRDRTSVHLYGEVTAPDSVTERLKNRAEGWLTTCGTPSKDLAGRIHSDAIDVLVDLAGWTGGSRLDAFAYRPAPVQLTWLGYAGTTGLAAATGIDGRITDAWADPPGMTEGHFTERLLRLPSGFLAYRPLAESPPPGPRPAEQRGRIAFGSFNNAAKISELTVALWSRTVNAVPGARLVLKNHALASRVVAEELRGRFARAGLGPDRLELRPPAEGYVDHLRAYDDIDIALDTFPYHGTTTTCEALWMGGPVVTLAGRTHAARVGVSLLQRLGLENLIAATPDEFVATAARLAGDSGRLSALRSDMRRRMREAPLFDPGTIARDLEALYRQLIVERAQRVA